MRTPHAETRYAAVFAVLAAAATAALLAAGGENAAAPSLAASSAQSWRGLVGSRPRVLLGQRVIVVLKTPSLGERVAGAGGAVDIEQEQAWTKVVQSAQRRLASRLSVSTRGAWHGDGRHRRSRRGGRRGAADPRGRVAARLVGDVGRLRAQRPGHRWARPRRRSQW